MPSIDTQIIRFLLRFARREELTDEQVRTLKEFLRRSPQHDELARQFGDPIWVEAMMLKLEAAPKKLSDEMSRRLDAMGAPQARLTSWRVAGWVTVYILLISLAGYLCRNLLGMNQVTKAPEVLTKELVIPDNDKVIWIGSDGQQVDVNKLPVGAVVSATGGRNLRTLDTNALAYDPATGQEENVWSFLVLGRKGTPYYLRMPDGSGAWLARGSSLRYFVNNRGIQGPTVLTGLGYFDVVKDTVRPWVMELPSSRQLVVKKGIFVVEDGKGQRMRVSLSSGKLQIFKKGMTSVDLRRGEEAMDNGRTVTIGKMKDPSPAMSWITPSLYFHFNNTPFETAVRQVASWYGYAIHNPGGINGTPITDDL